MILRAEKISKWYFRKSGESNRFFAVNETDFELTPGTLTVLMGRSGSGKTTLMHMLAGLLKPDSGIVRVDETDLYSLRDKELSRFRNEHISIIPQGHAAVQSLSVLENVMLPTLMYGGEAACGIAPEQVRMQTSTSAADPVGKLDLRTSAEKLLERFDISSLAGAYPSELSGGELRRMSVARSLLSGADILMADEPTGDLDDENTIVVMKALREAADMGKSVFVVTHEADALDYADQSYIMSSGTLQSNGDN